RGGAGEGEAGLLFPGDQVRPHPEGLFDGVEEVLPIHRVTRCRSGYGPHPLRPGSIDQLPILGKSGQGPLDGVVGETARSVHSPPQTGDPLPATHLLYAVRDEETHGVGADVDGGDPHGRGSHSGLGSPSITHGTTQSSGSIQPATRSPTGFSLPALVWA